MTLTNEQIEGWLAQTWAPGQYECEAEAANSDAGGWAGRVGSVVLIEHIDGRHSVEQYSSPEEADDHWDEYLEAYGEAKVYVVARIERIVANTPAQAARESERRIWQDDDVLYVSPPHEWAPNLEEETDNVDFDVTIVDRGECLYPESSA